MKLERKTLILIIGIVTAVALTVVIVAISMFAPKKDITPTPAPTTTPSVEAPIDPDEGTVIGDPDDPNAPPSDIYENDYSQDEGYAPLPDGFSPTEGNIANTVYDESWASEKYYTLICELSTKETVTEEALKPLLAFSDDLTGVKYGSAAGFMSNISYYYNLYKPYMNQLAPKDSRNILLEECSGYHEYNDSYGD